MSESPQIDVVSEEEEEPKQRSFTSFSISSILSRDSRPSEPPLTIPPPPDAAMLSR